MGKTDSDGKMNILAVIAFKGAKLFKAVKLLKVTKLLFSFGSMALSIVLYSFSMGIKFAVGFVAVIFIHEMGHVIAMHLRGYPARAPVFIPFLGAAIFVPGFRTSDDEAFIGYGGPFAGMLISAFLGGLWLVLPGHPISILRLSYVSTFINLFNLIPIRPLDGGRITQIAGEWFQWVGLAVFIAFVAHTRDLDLIWLIIIFLLEMKMDGRIRLAAGLGILITMMIWIFTGRSGESFWGAAITLFMVGYFNIHLYWTRSERIEKGKKIPPASASLRLGWFAAYAGLVLILWALMHFELPFIPPIKS